MLSFVTDEHPLFTDWHLSSYRFMKIRMIRNLPHSTCKIPHHLVGLGWVRSIASIRRFKRSVSLRLIEAYMTHIRVPLYRPLSWYMSQFQRNHVFQSSHFNLLHVWHITQSGRLFYADLYLLACAIEDMKWSCKSTYLGLANTSYTGSKICHRPIVLSEFQKGFLRARWRNPGNSRCRRNTTRRLHALDISGDCFADDMH